MISPVLLWNRALRSSDGDNDLLTNWVDALESCREAPESGDGLVVHAAHRRRRYLQCARQLSIFSDAHYYYRLMMWCHEQGVFVHPVVQMHRRPSPYRDHAFTVTCDVPRLTPLFAIPESLAIGFKDVNDMEDTSNSLHDEKREKEFNELNVGEKSNADVCQFFFSALGMIVSDLVTARSSPLTDQRWAFADLLGKVRTMKNAPYLEDNVVLDTDTSGLADVLLQMIRNYINGGPLVGKVDRSELRWAVSVCLSHSTPLVIAATRSIGVIPLVHLFPHGGKGTNACVIARTSHTAATKRIAAYFSENHGYDFSREREGKWIYVVSSQPLCAGEEIRLQAMAPVCEKDSEAEKMWRLSCGVVPEDYMPSSTVAKMQHRLTREIVECGGEILSRYRATA